MIPQRDPGWSAVWPRHRASRLCNASSSAARRAPIRSRLRGGARSVEAGVISVAGGVGGLLMEKWRRDGRRSRRANKGGCRGSTFCTNQGEVAEFCRRHGACRGIWVKTVEPSLVSSRVSAQEIAGLAYQYFLAEGCPEGRALNHWIRAENELNAQAIVEAVANPEASAAPMESRLPTPKAAAKFMLPEKMNS